MNKIVKLLETLGSGEIVPEDQLNELTEQELAIVSSRNLDGLKQLVDAPSKIVCAIAPAEDDEPGEEPSEEPKKEEEIKIA